MSTGLRAWVASHSETRWAIAVAILCAALVATALFWPHSPHQQSEEEMSAPVRMAVQSTPAPSEPAPKPIEAARPAVIVAPKPGEAAAPLPSNPKTIEPIKQAPATKPAATTAPTSTAHGYFVQVGAFRQQDHAEVLKKRLENHHWPVRIQRKKSNIYAVWVGGFTSKAEAEKAKASLAKQEKLQGFLTSR